MMKLQVVAFFVVTLCILDLVSTFSSGAPNKTCESMKPKHYVNRSQDDTKYESQTGQPYYSINVDRRIDIMAGQWVEVTLKADQHNFSGFILQAHKVNVVDGGQSNMHGEFIILDSDTKLVCNSKGVTHSGPKQFQTASFNWTAPAVEKTTCYQFVATVVREFSIYFMGVKSEEVCVSGAASLATAPFAALLMLIAALATAHIGRN